MHSPPLQAQSPADNTPKPRSGKALLLREAEAVRDPLRPAIPTDQRRYVVTLSDAADQDACVKTHGINREKSFRHALNGFVACLDDATVERLRDDPAVDGIEEDRPAAQNLSQIVPTGLKRMAVEQYPPMMINGLDERIDVDVAVMEGGVQTDHPDLNVYQTATMWGAFTPDDHATASAGVIGALDNGFGTVGIAPGVRIWSVQMNTGGTYYTSDIQNGFDYILLHADEIEVVNCSFASIYGSQTIRGDYEKMVQRCVDRGVVVVCGAGNSGKDIAGPDGTLDEWEYGISDNTRPAGLPCSMAVSAMDPVTDQFASYSNFSASNHTGRHVFSPGGAIDVAAPTSVATTITGGNYTTNYNGTSCATPHVAGLVALYIATHGRATDAAGVYRIRQAIVDAAQPQFQWQNPNTFDLDANHEGVAQASPSWASAGSPFRQMTKTPDSFILEFRTLFGYTHTLQHSDSLGMGAPWSDLLSVEGDGTVATAIHPQPGPKHFYRLQTRPLAWPPMDPVPAANLGSTGPAGAGTYILETRGISGSLMGDAQNTALEQPTTNLGSRVTVPFLPALNPGGAFSVELWARPALAGTRPYLYSPFLASSHHRVGDLYSGWFLAQNAGATSLDGFIFRCWTGGTNYVQITAPVAIDTTRWYQVVGVYDGVNVMLFVEGVLAANSAVPVGQAYQPNTARHLAFGADNRDCNGYIGALDEAAIYPFALTAAQVQAHYQTGIAPAPPMAYQQVILNDNPAGYWRFNDP